MERARPESNFLRFELHNKKGDVLIKPGEIVSISPAPEGGARIITRQKQTYYILELVDQVEEMIKIYFAKIKGEY